MSNQVAFIKESQWAGLPGPQEGGGHKTMETKVVTSVCRGDSQREHAGEGECAFSLSDSPPLPLASGRAKPSLQLAEVAALLGRVFVPVSGERPHQ